MAASSGLGTRHSWADGFAALEEFHREEGHCNPSVSEVRDGVRLCTWIRTQRKRRQRLPDEQRSRLDEIGFVWNAREQKWARGLAALKAFRMRESHCGVPQCHLEGDFKLGQWVSLQRKHRARLSVERTRALDDLGFVWNPRGDSWENMYERLMAYKMENLDCNVPAGYHDETLARWVRLQRRKRRSLAKDRRDLLVAAGFVWRPSAWQDGVRALQSFRRREGHFAVPDSHVEGMHGLGAWVAEQRKNRDSMNPFRWQQLEEMGFWDEPRRQTRDRPVSGPTDGIASPAARERQS